MNLRFGNEETGFLLRRESGNFTVLAKKAISCFSRSRYDIRLGMYKIMLAVIHVDVGGFYLYCKRTEWQSFFQMYVWHCVFKNDYGFYLRYIKLCGYVF